MALSRTVSLALFAAAAALAQDPIQSGEQLAEQGRYSEAAEQYQKALDAKPDNSLAHYRLGEVLWMEKSYQEAANEFLESINGDQQPAWTVVWAHIRLGMVFDVTGQRPRALEHYRLAIRTGNNSEHAQATAKQYLEKAYRAPGR